MIIENVSTLKIHKLTQEQYNRELAAGNIDESALYLTPDEELDLSGYATKEYADEVAAAVKDDLLNGAGEAYDTLKELGDLIEDNKDALESLEEIATGKADKEHTHEIADVIGLQNALDGKADTNHGVHVAYSDVAPEMDGVASVGVATTVARSDHKHPTDTTRAAQTDLDLIVNRVTNVESGLNSYVECSDEDILSMFK